MNLSFVVFGEVTLSRRQNEVFESAPGRFILELQHHELERLDEENYVGRAAPRPRLVHLQLLGGIILRLGEFTPERNGSR